MKKFARIFAIIICAVIAVSLFAFAACKNKDEPKTPSVDTEGEPSDDGDNTPDDSSDDTEDEPTEEIEQSYLLGIYDWDVYKLILEDENSAALIISGDVGEVSDGAAERQLSGEWELEDTTVTATFTEDLAAEAVTVASAEPLAVITLSTSIAEDGRVSMNGSVTYDGETKTAEFESPYEPVKTKSEWSDLIGTYSTSWHMENGIGSATIVIKENGFFSLTMKEIQVLSVLGYGILDGDTLTLVQDTTKIGNAYTYLDGTEILTVVRSDGTVKLIADGNIFLTKR